VHLPEIDKYAHLDSPLHRWDARAKLASLFALLVVVVFAPSYPTALVGLAVSVGLVGISRIPFRFVLVHVKWVLLFCAFLLVIMPLTAGGEALWQAGPLRVSASGLGRAGLVSVRAMAAVLLVYPMMGTARFHVSLQAARRLGVPRAAVQILAFSYRYAFVLFDELGRMLTAARARGLGRARGLRAFRNTGSMVGMLFVRSFDRTDRVYRAMLSRGYRGEAHTLDSFHLRAADLVKASLVVAVAAALLFAELNA